MAPEVAQLAHQYQGEVAVLGVGGLDEVGEIEAFVDRYELHHMTHAVTEDGELFSRFDILGQPAWVLIDADGEIVLRAVRPSMDDVRAGLDGLAAVTPTSGGER